MNNKAIQATQPISNEASTPAPMTERDVVRSTMQPDASSALKRLEDETAPLEAMLGRVNTGEALPGFESLEGKALSDVCQSFSLFLRASGVARGTILSKEDRKAYTRSFERINDLFLTAKGVRGDSNGVTISGQAATVLRLGKERFTGSNEYGLPTAVRQTVAVSYAPTVGQLVTYVETKANEVKRMQAGKRRLLASIKDAVKQS